MERLGRGRGEMAGQANLKTTRAGTPRAGEHACRHRPTVVTSLAVYSVAHFCVDLACAALVIIFLLPWARDFMGLVWGSGYNTYTGTPQTGTSLAVILPASAVIFFYNLFAFAFQLPIGMLADRHDDNAMIAAWGCATVIVAYAVGPVFPLLAAVIAGIGNAMFHVGAGLDTLNMSGTKRADLSGVFVSTGQMGLFIGMNLADLGLAVPKVALLVPVTLLALSGFAIVMNRQAVMQAGTGMHNVPLRPELIGMSRATKLALGGMFAAIALRSLLGFSLVLPWKSGFGDGMMVAAAVVLGKMLGGVIGDRVGWKGMVMTTLPLSAFLFLGAQESRLVALLALFLVKYTRLKSRASKAIRSSRRSVSHGARSAPEAHGPSCGHSETQCPQTPRT